MFQRVAALALLLTFAPACSKEDPVEDPTSEGDQTPDGGGTVVCPGPKPVAAAGNDRTAAVGSTVVLNGASANVVPSSFTWLLVRVPEGSQATLRNPTLANPTFVPDRAGNYEASLVVSDGCQSSAPDTVTIVVSGSGPQDTRPVAYAGSNRTVSRGVLVQLSGAGSYSPVGGSLSYAWSLVARPAGSAAQLGATSTLSTSFTADVDGEYRVELVVSTATASSEPATVTITAANQAPTARAGSSRTVPRRTRVALDGSASSDPEGDTLTYAWTLSAPAGSSAALSSASAVRPEFTPDLEGSYVVQLVVSDGHLGSSASSATFTAVNTRPTASTAAAVPSVVGQAVALDGTASDEDGDPLTYTWSLLERPAGSAAALSDPAAVDPQLTVDVEGDYLLTFAVSDGVNQTSPISVTVTAYRPIHLLAHRVVDAEYSRALERVVMVAESPSALYIFDPVARTETTVALPAVPSSVSVSPDGNYAAVGHNGYVSYVDLVNAQRVRTLPIGCDVGDVVLAGNGFAYAFPRVDQWVVIHSLDLTTGAETLSGGWSLYAGTRARLHPDGVRMYGANNGLSPSDIERYAIDARGTAQNLWDSPYHGDYPMCGDLWFSEDGARIFTRCGRVFRTAATQAEDMRYGGALSGADYITSLSHSAAAGSIAVTLGTTYFGAPDARTRLLFFEDEFLAAERTVRLPRYVRSAQGYDAAGRFVFYSGAGDKLFVLVQVDPSASLLNEFGLVTY